MRKYIKIKAVSIFVAWFLIFAHNIIPHNHADEKHGNCHEIFHQAGITGQSCTGHHEAGRQPAGKSICHFSGLMVLHHGHDTLVFPENVTTTYYLSVPEGMPLLYNYNLFIPDRYWSISLLRAPPLS